MLIPGSGTDSNYFLKFAAKVDFFFKSLIMKLVFLSNVAPAWYRFNVNYNHNIQIKNTNVLLVQLQSPT